MAAAKPGKSLLMALALGKPKAGAEPSDDEGEGDVDTGGEAKLQAARDALRAFKSGDAEALSQALSDHYDACAASESGEDYEGDESGEEA